MILEHLLFHHQFYECQLIDPIIKTYMLLLIYYVLVNNRCSGVLYVL